MSGSAASFSESSDMLLPMISGFSNAALTSDSTVRSFPSQPKRKLSAALNTVSVLSGRLDPSRPTSWLFVLAPFVPRSWQDVQLRELPRDSRGSPNRRSPSFIFLGSVSGGAGMGVIGSSAFAMLDCSGCAGVCDDAGQSCKPPRISTQIAAGRRSRAIFPFPGGVSCCEGIRRGMLGNCWSTQPYSMRHWPRRPTPDTWGRFADCEAGADAAPAEQGVGSNDSDAAWISSRDNILRPARS